MKKSIVAGTLALLAAAAGAQVAYKYELPDGRLVYSDKPIEGARLVDRIPLDPTAPVPGAQTAAPSEAPQAPPAAAQSMQGRRAALDQAYDEIKAAQKAVDDAKERLQQGVEPYPGERQANVNGSSRLNEDYFARVRQLEQDLRDASARLDEAYAKRNQAR
jgi:hypothetical protein